MKASKMDDCDLFIISLCRLGVSCQRAKEYQDAKYIYLPFPYQCCEYGIRSLISLFSCVRKLYLQHVLGHDPACCSFGILSRLTSARNPMLRRTLVTDPHSCQLIGYLRSTLKSERELLYIVMIGIFHTKSRLY